MLIPTGTLLARARRNHHLIPFLTVSIPEIAEATVRTAEAVKGRVILQIEIQSKSSPEEIVFLVQACKLLARTSSAEIGVHVALLDEDKLWLDYLCAENNLSLSISGPLAHPRGKGEQFLEEALKAAHHDEIEILLTSQHYVGLNRLLEAAEMTAVQALITPLVPPESARSNFSPGHVRDLIKSVKIPVIAYGAEQLRPATRQQLMKAGVGGSSFGASFLDEAFSAGLRTGLRDRSVATPSRYLRFARKAVASAVEPLLTSI